MRLLRWLKKRLGPRKPPQTTRENGKHRLPIVMLLLVAGCGGATASLDEQIASGPIQWRADQRVGNCAQQSDTRASCVVTNVATGQSTLALFREDVCAECDDGRGWYLADSSIDRLP